jgi:hypothetical protein
MRLLARLLRWLQPPPDQTSTIQALTSVLAKLNPKEAESIRQRWQLEDAVEWQEARNFAGSGPWLTAEGRQAVAENASGKELAKLRESNPLLSQGAFGDIELALQNVEWRREINLSWLEFSRWGIQQIILISRLYYIKNPIVRRLIDVSSVYVFGRGFEVTSENPDANDTLKEFFDRNKKVLGQVNMADLERRKFYDGNLFFAFFVEQATGLTTVRMIDATEIMDIITDPDDTDQPWYYRRVWVAREFDVETGQVRTQGQECYHPALNFDPAVKPATINAKPVMWDIPLYHRKCGGVAKWNFGCPQIYPAIDWAKAARRFLEACATVKQALATFAMTVNTKGGQQAIEGLKQQLSTTVGPSAAIWDTNPPPVNAATFVSGPGTELQFLNQSGKGGDPEEVRRFLLMCCMTVGVPETFLSDVSTGNLATATTLDRPTELVFLEKQEAWREDLSVIAIYVLNAAKGAAKGKLKEALDRDGLKVSEVRIVESARAMGADGRWKYVEAKAKNPKQIEVKVTFPAIREGDMLQRVQGIVEAMTLANKGGQITGIDEKTGVLMLLQELGYENAEELVEEMYPKGEYDPDRTKEELAAPIAPAMPSPAGTIQTQVQGQPSGNPTSQPGTVDQQPLGDAMKEAVRLRIGVEKLLAEHAKAKNGDSKLVRA